MLSLRQPAGKATYEDLEQRFLHALKFKKLLKRNEAPTERSQGEE